jgi:hypothetical protein
VTLGGEGVDEVSHRLFFALLAILTAVLIAIIVSKFFLGQGKIRLKRYFLSNSFNITKQFRPKI